MQSLTTGPQGKSPSQLSLDGRKTAGEEKERDVFSHDIFHIILLAEGEGWGREGGCCREKNYCLYEKYILFPSPSVVPTIENIAVSLQ